MTPREFLIRVSRENRLSFNRTSEDLRLAINAVMTLDAVVGFAYVSLLKCSHPFLGAINSDEGLRDKLSHGGSQYAFVRDASAAIKHGEVTRKLHIRKLTQASDIGSMPVGVIGEVAIGRDAFLASVVHFGILRADDVLYAAEKEIETFLAKVGL